MQDKELLDRIICYVVNNKEVGILKEIEVDDANGRYFIDRQGKVISLCKEVATELQPIDNGKGYKKVQIGSKSYYIHRLVAKAFLVYQEEDKEIHHIDRNRNNNNASNLLPIDKKKHRLIHSLLDKWESMGKV